MPCNWKASLLSKCVLDIQPYNTIQTDVTWETCTLRSWLNKDFYQSAFNATEKNKIQITNVKNDDNPEAGTPGGNDTEDKIFLLSIGEAQQYFSSNSERICCPTQYAKDKGCRTDNKGACSWVLRSPGVFRDFVSIVHADGNIYYFNDYSFAVKFNCGVRPALWISP